MPEPEFLTIEVVEQIHADQLARYGGADGYVDRNVVESAVASPRWVYRGEFENTDIADLAAVYLFKLATTQGFRDGNKRTALVSATTFLNINGFDLDATADDVYRLTIAVAKGSVSKDSAADWIRDKLIPVPDA
jgi:death-on-curing protein